jgi:precorrin-2 dehydrogenase/sirohydrochlorin ferrochelatase
LVQLAEEDRIALKQRAYRSSDLETMFLVIGATDNENLNRRIHADAETRQCLCNIADQPHLCNFILPAVVQQGDLVITISTSGRSPAFAKYLRHQMQDWFGPEYALFLELMGAVRERLLAVEHAPEVHKPLFEKLIQGRLPELIKTDDRSAIDALLTEVLGKGFTYADLMTKE